MDKEFEGGEMFSVMNNFPDEKAKVELCDT